MENETYTLAMFMDTNFTKPRKLRLSVQDFYAISDEAISVRNMLANLTQEQIGFNDILMYKAVLEVSSFLEKHKMKTHWQGPNSNIEITFPIHICLYLIDILSVKDDSEYISDIRIVRGNLDTIISKNEFTAKFSSVNEILQQFEADPEPPIKIEPREPQKLGEVSQKLLQYG